VTAIPGTGSFTNQGYTSTVFGDPTCLFCGQSLDVRATGDGSGTFKLFTGVGMSPHTGGFALADLALDDILDNVSPSLGINLDSFFSAFERGPTTFFPFTSYTTGASISMNLDLQGFDPDDPDAQGHLYSFLLLAYTSYDNNAQQAGSEGWQIQKSVDNGSPVTLSAGSSLAALGGHLGYSGTVDTSGSPSWSLSLAAHSEAICSGGAVAGPPAMTCSATFNSWNTTHLGIEGTFTSESGYTYDGFAAAVPEPGTLALCLPAALAWMLRRRLARHSFTERPVAKE
jgi:hypothetical protein